MSIFESIHEENLSIKVQSEILFSPEKKDLRPRKNLFPGMFQEQKRTYIKVSKESKEQLRELVFKEGFKIKDAAKKLFIKYATAKTIVFHWRKKCQKQKKQESKFSRYIQLQGLISIKLKIISIIQQKLMSSVEYIVQHPSCGQCYKRLED
ncbi:unnamed protein product (macronuclear) [Paramecium tetraurelia]|uniref:Transposase Synechocystis PCC 6803 domain-containing protein n=1 Tax=Paramecium tetraurelia TaxID=5888 RepID=A0C6G7_PARTE|nr:uncharacterized protein GSPATT00035513001 [Paramecium tetraurelia]CAK66384.1 unnamed protein product [Paramecium tetraurelia]|eukprot:XP_001433781.1 hypothetical protein (macronuclear) [Paramecium tetraurelia strain d4-2]